MKILQIVREKLLAMGFDANSSPINMHHARAIFAFVTAIISQFVYLVYEAKKVGELMRCFFMIIVAIAIFTSFCSMISIKTKLHDFIDDYQKFIDESEWMEIIQRP